MAIRSPWTTLMHSESGQGVARRFIVPCLLLVTAVCYWETLDTFFVQDDFTILAAVRKPLPNMEMLRGSCFFRPLSTYWLTLANVSLWGFEPFWHHATHLAIFLATVWLLYRWLLEVSGRAVAALVGAGLYAFSKTHLYTLAWIAGGIDVLAALFLVLCLWSIDRYLRQSDDGRKKSGFLLGAVGMTFVGGLLCKESCIVLAPVGWGWIAARRYLLDRKIGKPELRLAGLMAAVVIAYLPLWKMASNAAGLPESHMTFAPSRGLHVLQDSVIALIPLREAALPQTIWWLVPAAVLIAWTAYSRPGRSERGVYLVVGLLLWTLPAAMFVFTEYPWGLQLYYSHFSVIGLTLIAALGVAAVQHGFDALAEKGMQKQSRLTALRGSAIAVMAVWAVLAATTIRTSVHKHLSPALHEAQYSKAAYDQIHNWLRDGSHRRIVFLNTNGLLWASVQYGTMIPAMFPGVEFACDGRDGFHWSESEQPPPATLIIRQTGDRSFRVVQ